VKSSLLAALVAALFVTGLAAPGGASPSGARVVEGVVVKVDADEVVIDLGRAVGLPSGEAVHLFRRMVVKHPISGEVIEDRFPIGTVQPAQVGELLTIIRDLGGLERPPVPGDFAVYRPVVSPSRPVSAPSEARPGPPGGSSEADTIALEGTHAAMLGQSLPRRIELYEGFVRAFPESRHVDAVGRELVALQALLTQVQGGSAASEGTTIAGPDGLTVRHLAPRPIIAGERLEVAVAVVEGERIRELRLLAARAGSETWVVRSMAREGDFYHRFDVPAELVSEAGAVNYVIEAVRSDGRLEAIVGEHARPVVLTVESLPAGRQPPGDSRLDVVARYVDFNTGGDATDGYFQFESTFTYELALWAVRAVRVGVGVIDGEGGPTDAIDAGAATETISLNYAFAEGEFDAGDWVGIALRVIGGNRQSSDDSPTEAMTGLETRLRIGRFDETRVVAGVAVLDVLGAKAFLDMHIEVFDRLPMRAGVVVTNLPVDADIGVQLDYQIGYEINDLLAVHAQVGWNARTINHYGFTGGGGLSLAW
jgi:hypothetical protein